LSDAIHPPDTSRRAVRLRGAVLARRTLPISDVADKQVFAFAPRGSGVRCSSLASSRE